MNKENEEIYLEIKQIPFAFESCKEIGNSKSYERIIFLVCEVLDIYENYYEIIKKEYLIRIKEGYISEFDFSTFYEKSQNSPEEINKEVIKFIEEFSNYVYKNENKWSTYEFKRRKNTIVIEFVKKNSLQKEEERINIQNEKKDINDKLSVSGLLIEQNGILFDIPINISGGISAHNYVSLLVNPDKLLNQMLENFKKAKNSFYGIESQRYMIHDVFFKHNNDTLYVVNDDLSIIGNALIYNIKSALESNMDIIKKYKEYYDKSYIFVTLENSIYSFELF